MYFVFCCQVSIAIFDIFSYAIPSEWQVSTGDDTNSLDRSFRRCSYTPKSSLNMTECYTPGSLIVKAGVKETPKSTRGSSMFSPGEAFWNEAIQLADGLCAPGVDNCFEIVGDTDVAKDQVCLENSCNLQNTESKPRKMLDQSESRIENMQKGGPLGLVGLHAKDSVKEVSSLPVKHFDFSLDDTNLDENSPQQCRADELISVSHEAHRGYEFSSVKNKKMKNSKTFTVVGTAHTNEKTNEVKEKTSSRALCQKVNLQSQDNDSLTFNSPFIEDRRSIGTHPSNETSTPSSHVSLSDRLDLSRWLPSEICSIYRNKGISKLYHWQVCMIFMWK